MKKISVKSLCLLLVFSTFLAATLTLVDSDQEIETVENLKNPAVQVTETKNEDRVPAQVAAEMETPSPTTTLQTINKIKACLESGTCDYPQTDPKSYEIAVMADLNKELLTYLDNYKAGLGSDLELQQLAKEFIGFDNGFVQETALKMMSELPPSSEILDALTQALPDCHDPLIIRQALNEFKRYLNSPEEKKVHDFLKTQVAYGPHFSSEAAASEILPFINETSYPVYNQAYHSMKKPSKAATYLKSALEEYRRITHGG